MAVDANVVVATRDDAGTNKRLMSGFRSIGGRNLKSYIIKAGPSAALIEKISSFYSKIQIVG